MTGNTRIDRGWSRDHYSVILLEQCVRARARHPPVPACANPSFVEMRVMANVVVSSKKKELLQDWGRAAGQPTASAFCPEFQGVGGKKSRSRLEPKMATQRACVSALHCVMCVTHDVHVVTLYTQALCAAQLQTGKKSQNKKRKQCITITDGVSVFQAKCEV